MVGSVSASKRTFRLFVCGGLLISLVVSCNAKDPANPDVFLTTPEIIRHHGYPAETHLITTADGYILTLHRIPFYKHSGPGNQRQPVLLHHAFIESSADFVITGPEKGLAFILSRAGYDVWLANARGNTYSRAHINYTASDAEFWNFSWDEMAQYDLPVTIDFIAAQTNQPGNILYIGHSMGTTIFYALMATQPEYNAKIKAMFALAPVTILTHVVSPIKYIAPLSKYFEWITRMLGQNELLPNNAIMKVLAKYGCGKFTPLKAVCKSVIFFFCGFDKAQFNTTLLPAILHHTPAGTSTRTLIHYAQGLQAKRFQKYDYGTSKNIVRYGTNSPPEYDLSQVTVPTAVFYSENDWMASPKDVENMYPMLPNRIDIYKVPFQNFNHIDFVWGKDAPTLVYDHLLFLMGKYK